MNTQHLSSADVTLGTVVSVPNLIYRHVGIVTNRRVGGFPTVIANSSQNGGVTEVTWREFAGEREVSIVGFPGILPPSEVLLRAQRMLATRYDLFRWNCEHFVRYAHGQPSESPQLAFGITALLFALFLARA